MTSSWQDLLPRLTAVQPAPEPATAALLGAAALALVVLAWPVTRMAVTVTHEAGHAIAAVLTGRRLTGIRLHSDTSGLTVSRGRPAGPGMVATLLAGYPAPGLVGLGAAVLLSSGRAVIVVALLVVVLAAMLVLIRNFFGVAVLVIGLAGVVAAAWYLSPLHQSLLAHLITWTLLLAAPRPVLELARHRSTVSDSAQLARITRVPGAVWTAVFAASALVTSVAGVGVLARDALGW